jgi:hypothetical protein
MSRIVFTLVLLAIIAALACNGCISTPAPTIPPTPDPTPAPTPSSFPEPVHPPTPASVTPQPSATQQELSWQDIQSQMRIIEFPETAYVGEYITVKVQILGDNLRDQMISSENQQIRELLWLLEDGNYELALYKDTLEWVYNTSFGTTNPDGDNIVCWYSSIPTTGAFYELNDEGKYERHEGPLPAGSYKLELRLLNAGYDVLLDRNIVIKD